MAAAREETPVIESSAASTDTCADEVQFLSDSMEHAARRAEQRAGSIAVTGRYHRLPRLFEDDYVLEAKVLGSGANGLVQTCACKHSGAKFALKSFKLQGLSSDKRKFLYNEAEIFLGMDHPHVARLVDVYESEVELCLVMERMTGGELFDRVKDVKRFSERQAAGAAYQMLLALNYIHGHHVVHRDVKLENFLYEAKGKDHLKLIDFGFSKIWDAGRSMALSCGTLAYVAPEVLEKSYTSQCDMWSFGVIVFILLAGYMPFSGTEANQMSSIKKGKFELRQEVWQRVSAEALDFVRRLLVVEYEARMTADQALKHPWIADLNNAGSVHSDTVHEETVHALIRFGKTSTMRRACLNVMAWSLTSEERAKVRDEFLRLDHQHTGSISLEDFRSVLEGRFHVDDEKVLAAFAALDNDHSDEIQYSEFLAAMVTSRIQLHDELLHNTFRRFDTQGSGYITMEDLEAVLGGQFDGEQLRALMTEADVSQDGKISFSEFISYLKSDRACQTHKDAAHRVIDGELKNSSSCAALPTRSISGFVGKTMIEKPEDAVEQERRKAKAAEAPTARSQPAKVAETGREPLVFLTREELSLDPLVKAVGDDACGAITTFSGTTRNHFEGKEVLRLEYEAYEPMALKELKQLTTQTLAKYSHVGVRHVACAHRLGVVPCGEASVLIAVSSEHRAAAFDACRWMIDTLKARVPIWKKEIYADGSKWKENAEWVAPAVQPNDSESGCGADSTAVPDSSEAGSEATEVKRKTSLLDTASTLWGKMPSRAETTKKIEKLKDGAQRAKTNAKDIAQGIHSKLQMPTAAPNPGQLFAGVVAGARQRFNSGSAQQAASNSGSQCGPFTASAYQNLVGDLERHRLLDLASASMGEDVRAAFSTISGPSAAPERTAEGTADIEPHIRYPEHVGAMAASQGSGGGAEDGEEDECKDAMNALRSDIGALSIDGFNLLQTHQDGFFWLRAPGDFGLYMIVDGHGDHGHVVSAFVRDMLPKLVLRNATRMRSLSQAQPAMLSDVFKTMQSLLEHRLAIEELEAPRPGAKASSGAQCVVALHDERGGHLCVANVGLACACLASMGPEGVADSVRTRGSLLTTLHTPNIPEERKRIEACGGRVVYDGHSRFRVCGRLGRAPGLPVARSFGDCPAHALGISCEPTIVERTLVERDRALVLYSYGVGEVMAPPEVASVAISSLMSGSSSSTSAPRSGEAESAAGPDAAGAASTSAAQAAAEKVAKEAWSRWMKEEGGSHVCSISVVVVPLHPAGSSSAAAALPQVARIVPPPVTPPPWKQKEAAQSAAEAVAAASAPDVAGGS